MQRIIQITDIHDQVLDIYTRLNETQLLHFHEPNPGIFIAESPKVIFRALDAGYTPISILMEEKQIQTQGKELIERCTDIPIYVADSEILAQIKGFQLTRGALCAMRRIELPSVNDVCQKAERIAILEDIVNPTNIGAIFRSAAALKIDGIILTNACADPLYRRAIRVSMGTVFQIPWTIWKKNWTINGIAALRKMGFSTVALALDKKAIPITDQKLQHLKKIAMVFGTEGNGLTMQTIANCDYVVKIPMAEGVDSLNVAAASAVAFWELSMEKQKKFL